LFDTIGIYHWKIYKILAYYINHIGIISSSWINQPWFFQLKNNRKAPAILQELLLTISLKTIVAIKPDLFYESPHSGNADRLNHWDPVLKVMH
jgi:ABC-type Fe3+-hydroxamate transport system substrate-binding protein